MLTTCNLRSSSINRIWQKLPTTKFWKNWQTCIHHWDTRFFVCSAETGDGLEEIRAFIKAKTTAFIGPSGVGKTSLINALIPNQNLRIGEISDYSNKGKHTTTVARLIPVPEGGYIADTPGIREFGIVGIEPWELSLYFPEMIIPRKNCKFNTCTHDHEPNCGVESAHAAGKIADSRYRSYLNILDSLKNRSER